MMFSISSGHSIDISGLSIDRYLAKLLRHVSYLNRMRQRRRDPSLADCCLRLPPDDAPPPPRVSSCLSIVIRRPRRGVQHRYSRSPFSRIWKWTAVRWDTVDSLQKPSRSVGEFSRSRRREGDAWRPSPPLAPVEEEEEEEDGSTPSEGEPSDESTNSSPMGCSASARGPSYVA